MVIRSFALIALAGAGVGSLTAAQAAPVVYHAVDLQALPGSPAESTGQGIAGNGYTAGTSWSAADAQYHAVRNTGGGPQDLGSLGAGLGSFGQGINAGGTVIGGANFINSRGDANGTHATVFTGSGIVDIGATNGDYASFGYAINNKGQATGWATTYFDGFGGQRTGAFFYDGGTLRDLGTLGGNSAVGRAINEAGVIAGYSTIDAGSRVHAFVSNGETLVDIGTFGGDNSFAYDVNSHGDVVGGAYLTYRPGHTYDEHAFIYRNGQLIDIGTLDGGVRAEARGINDDGWVVGVSETPNGQAGFLYDGNVMTELGSLIVSGFDGWTIFDISGINDDGQIVGSATNGSVIHAFPIRPDRGQHRARAGQPAAGAGGPGRGGCGRRAPAAGLTPTQRAGPALPPGTGQPSSSARRVTTQTASAAAKPDSAVASPAWVRRRMISWSTPWSWCTAWLCSISICAMSSHSS